MRAYRVASGQRVEPFGDLARDLHIATRTLDDWQRSACGACDLELTDIDDLAAAAERPCVLFYDNVFFTEMALRNFVADTLRSTEDVAMAMPASFAVRALEPASDARPGPDDSRVYDVFSLRAPGEVKTRSALVERCRPLVQRRMEKSVEIRLPREETGADIALTARVVAHVRHWIHVFRLSQLAIGVMLLDRLRVEPRRILKLRLSRKDRWSLGPLLNFVHPSARVHPKADLEASIIGPDCVVRAHAHVHNSVLGEGVEVGDHAVVMGCAFAERVQILRASYLAHCVAMPGATLANYKVQLSLFGRDVFLTTSAWLLDAKLKGEIRIEHGGDLIPIGSPFLGVCAGHRVTLGAQATIQAGRAIPNGSTIIGPPEHIALDLPLYPEDSILTVRNGRVVPLDPRVRAAARPSTDASKNGAGSDD